MDRRASRRHPARARSGGARRSISQRQQQPAFADDQDDDDHDDGEVVRGGGSAAAVPAYAQDDYDSEGDDNNNNEEDDEEDDDDEEYNQRGRRLTAGGDLRYSTGSYLPTAYGAPGGPEAALALGVQPSQRERSVDRIRARSRDRRRDISKDRHSQRDRSRSSSQSRNSNTGGGNNKANDRAAQRRRDRRASLEMSLGTMSMDDSASSFDQASVYSTSNESSFSLINGMDSSFSQSLSADVGSNTDPKRRARKGGRPGNLASSSRDSTSTDYTSDRRRHVYKSGKASKTWDGRLDHVLNLRRGGRPTGGGDAGGGAAQARSLSPGATGGKEKRGGKRSGASAR
ncbi:expressed unknown protein [Seminavis robusta]|uniref:Uncharacterized protein n=1 Tax=Seminavis robusta TaxID=568900 RepID=A0A9N8HTH4_9STRA|nr:expressed unknown protein [Seminavis robusta]|eukprot:Sro1275_g258460.1 n/a (343) ;mRNA; f:5820-6848